MAELSDAVTEITRPRTCLVATIRASLSKGNQTDLDTLLTADPKQVRHTVIRDGLTKIGSPIPTQTADHAAKVIADHRRGKCSCSRQ